MMNLLDTKAAQTSYPARWLKMAGAIAWAALALSACVSASGSKPVVAGRGNGVAGAEAAAAVEIVEPAFKPMTTWGFDPASLTVGVGTTITWTNGGSAHHTVTSLDDNATFDSADLAPGASFSWTATTAGTYPYYCVYHDWMKGTIVVAR